MLIRTEFFFFEVNVEKKASLNENFTSMNFSRLLIHQGFNGPRVKYVENFLRKTNEKKNGASNVSNRRQRNLKIFYRQTIRSSDHHLSHRLPLNILTKKQKKKK